MSITHSVLVDVDNLGIETANSKSICNGITYTGLIALRKMNPPITTIAGRNVGTILNFNLYHYSDYTMRRKAETLKYNKNNLGLTKKQLYARTTKISSGSYFYSAQDLLNYNRSKPECNIINIKHVPPTNSGIHDTTFQGGYYYDPNIPYLPSL